MLTAFFYLTLNKYSNWMFCVLGGGTETTGGVGAYYGGK